MSTDIVEKQQIQASTKYRFTAEDYQRMGEAGVFVDNPRIELINGEIYTMSPISSEHNSHVDKISRFFQKTILSQVLIRTQGSIRIDDYSEPEPDIVLLHLSEDYYHARQPKPEDIYLIVEVAVNTKDTDRGIKLSKYAAAGIPEYWIIIPSEGIIEVYQNPEAGTYREKRTYRKTDEWKLDAFDLAIKGSNLLI